MSRFAAKPIPLPSGVNCQINADSITISGGLGKLHLSTHASVKVSQVEEGLSVESVGEKMTPLVGTYCRLLQNNIFGVTQGFQRKLLLVGVGYRASLKGKTLVLQLGFSHPVEMTPPADISIELPVQTEIIVKGIDKQKVNQYSADIRKWRQPEPYKGKGIKYDDEVILRKEVKKK